MAELHGCTFKQERFVWLVYTLKSREVCMAWLHVEIKRDLYGLVQERFVWPGYTLK